ncbi:MAG: hypothetical protein HYU67_11675 [Flavobacteriia bacterium]|nr:hypothetical protein [Flavobacteriia bacterium]
MISTLLKRKVTEKQMANLFVNGLFKIVVEGFPEVAAFINEENSFENSPNISSENLDHFAMIVFAGNLNYLENIFEIKEVNLIEKNIFNNLASIYNTESDIIKNLVREYQGFMAQKNIPSKNTLYAMSKAVFYKYKLNDYQNSYFSDMQVPNPIFLKRLDDIMRNFLWDWDAFFKKYKIVVEED